MTPDPRDHTISKRKWKHEVDQWRKALEKLCADECRGSTVSTEEGEECLSRATVTSETDSAYRSAYLVDYDFESGL